jgi:glutathione S-transferase
LEEAGMTYKVRLIDQNVQKSVDYRAWQPFGQVPAIDDDGLVLFESGAIVLHIGEHCDTLLPADKRQQARAITWSFAALNSIEQPLQELGLLNLLWTNEDWAIQRRPILDAFVNQRLNDLSASLGNGEYLEDRFTAADLFAYKERCEARSAFQRALRAQMQDFVRNAPPDGLIRVAQGGSQMNVERKE